MRRWFRRREKAQRDTAAELPGATVRVVCHDDTRAVSAVLSEAGMTEEAESLLRHLVFVPREAVNVVLARCDADGYVPAPELPSDPPVPDGLEAVAVARVVCIDARTVSQERSVISSMTARLGGQAGGWAVLEAVEE